MPSKSPGKGRPTLRLGKYDLYSQAQTWDTGDVYKASDVDTGQDLAVKILPAAWSARPGLCQRLQQGVAQAAQLDHPNILKVYEVGEDNGTWFLAMELVEGRLLSDYLADTGALDVRVALRFLTQGAEALACAFKNKIVAPDTTPRGFLVTDKNSLMLLPVFLPQEGKGGPVTAGEYLAPEQTRDKKTRDIRSAIYTLGKTFSLMLTGAQPGSEAEKLENNVPEAVLSIMNCMSARKPDDRYQSPADLLEALSSVTLDEPAEDGETEPDSAHEAAESEDETAESEDETAESEAEAAGEGQAEDEYGEDGAPPILDEDERVGLPDGDQDDVLAGLAAGEEETPEERLPRKKPEPKVKKPTGQPAPGETATETESKPEKKRPPARLPPWLQSPYVLAGAGGTVLLAGLIFMLLGNRTPEPPPRDNSPVQGKKGPIQKPDDGDKPGDKGPAIDVAQVKLEFEEPWAKPHAIPPKAPVLLVNRSGTIAGAKAGSVFHSLSAAIAAAPANGWAIIEIHDNGPLFEMPIGSSGRNLWIRGVPASQDGPGYQPLIVWDLVKWKKTKQAPQSAPTFLSVERGDLMLSHLSLALDSPENATSLVRISGGDFQSWNCTFSVASRNKVPITVVRLDGKEPGKRCRLSNCLARGANLVGLELLAPAPEAMIENCLLVGGDLPLIRSKAGADVEKVPTVRVVRSTLTADKHILQVQPATTDPTRPVFRWMGWDALLVSKGAGDSMVDIPGQGSDDGLQFRTINCLYAGWKKLASGRDPIVDLDNWQKRSPLSVGDRATEKGWESLAGIDPSRMSAELFNTEKTDLAFPASFGSGMIGCFLPYLPWARSNWQDLAYRPFPVLPPTPPATLPKDAKPPAIPESQDGKYHGGRVDLNKKDIAEHLEEVKKKQPLAATVVLHLAGSGERAVRPIHLKKTNLILYFEPPPKGKAPIVLVPDTGGSPAANALFHMEGGNLDIIGADIRCLDAKTAKVPHYLIQIWNGTLRIERSRLQGPLATPPASYWGLIRLEGSGSTDPKQVSSCAVRESILQSAHIGIHVVGAGTRLHLEQCLFLCADHAIHFQFPSDVPQALNVHCTLEQNTIAARRSLVYLEDVPWPRAQAWPEQRLWLTAPLAEPVVVQSKANLFLNPFLTAEMKTFPASLLVYRGLALTRGALAWQSRGDAYDKRFAACALAAGADGRPPDKSEPQDFSVWEGLWGTFGCQDPIANVEFNSVIRLDQPQLDLLAYPTTGLGTPGADLKRLGLGKKKGTE
jgi:serine/threonine-protein kinase